jgi:NADPH2:quinone reductase
VKAIRVRAHGGPEVLVLDEVPDPRPGKGEVLVRVRAAGVNPVEAYLRAGTHYRVPSFPWTPGTDAGGEVEAVGPGVGDFQPGDRVYTAGSLSGTYAEKALCSGDQVHPLPARCSFPQGAAVHVPYATAWRALHGKARVAAGEVVLVHGATGGVGLAAVQVACAARAVVIGTGGTERGRAAAREQGAALVLDHGKPGYLDAIAGFTGGRGPDVILEMLADRNLAEDLRVAAKGGRIVVIGSRGSIAIEPRTAMAGDLAVLGMSLFNVPREDLAAIHAEIVKGLEAGILRPVVGAEIPLAEAARAHERVMAPGALGKVVLVP